MNARGGAIAASADSLFRKDRPRRRICAAKPDRIGSGDSQADRRLVGTAYGAKTRVQPEHLRAEPVTVGRDGKSYPAAKPAAKQQQELSTTGQLEAQAYRHLDKIVEALRQMSQA